MEYINKLDSGIDHVLNNDIIYSCLILLLIVYTTFLSGSYTIEQTNIFNKFFKINFNITLVKILFILCILFFATKDIRISLLLLIIFFIEIDKIHVDEVNGELIAFLVNDSIKSENINGIAIQEKINKLTQLNK